MEPILFVASVFNEMQQGRIPGSGNLWTRIRMILQQGSSCPTATDKDTDVLVDLRLWILFLARVSIIGGTVMYGSGDGI